MMTSCFSRLRHIPPGMRPVAIVRFLPDYYIGQVCQPLAPSQSIFRMEGDSWIEPFKAQLAKLDPVRLFEQLGDNAVLLCYERPTDDGAIYCHRRIVAEWFEENLGIAVPEMP